MSLYPSQAMQLHRKWCREKAATLAAELNHPQVPHSMRAQALREVQPRRNADGTLADWWALYGERAE